MPIEGISNGGRADELLRYASEIVVELRPDGRIVYISPAVEAILGRPAAYFTDLSFLEVVVPDDRQAMLAEFRKVVETGGAPLFIFRATRHDGHRVEFETSLRSFLDDDGSQRVVCVCRDVTARSAQLESDRRKNRYYQAIAESGSRPAAITTTSGEIEFSNRRFKEVFGHHENIQELRARLTDDTRVGMDSAWYQANRPDGTGSGASDFEYCHPDGSKSWYAAAWETVRPHDGPRKFAVLYEDITRRKRIEEALRIIASGLAGTDTDTLRTMISMIGEALEMDRLVVGLLDAGAPEELDVLVAWQDGAFLDVEPLALEGLPDLTVARGEACIHPIAIGQLMPAVFERIGHDFTSYAGLPLRGRDGRVLGIIGGYSRKTIQDTDLVRSLLSSFATHASAAIDRQHADADVRANRDRFDALARHADEMLIEVDEDLRITYISPASLSVLGYEPEALLGRMIEDVTHPDDFQIVVQSRDRIASGQQHSMTVTRCRHADGSWRWLESRASAFQASDLSSRTLILSRDITESRSGELGRELLYQVLQRGRDLVFVCAPDATLLFANDAAARLIHDPADKHVERQAFSDLLTPTDADRLRNEILTDLSSVEAWSGELELRGWQDERPIATEATIFLFDGSEDNPGTFLAITLRDITQRRSAEQALLESELRLGQAQKMEAVGRLAGGIAHDFNNLLTAIIGYSDLVLDELGEGHGARRDTEEILRAAERAGGLTRQLLAFSRRQVLRPESVDLNAVVADIDRMMRRLIGENIELVTVQDGELRPIVADPGQIEQIIVNLVVNARDAMPRGGRIEIETANFRADKPLRTDSGDLEIGDYVVLRVRDNGIGMDETVRAQIFEPFFTTKETHEGTGLGLTLAYEFVRHGGGQIQVESALEHGSTFTIYLPAAKSESEDALVPVARERRPNGSETILLVEDAAPVRHLVQRTLEKSGYTVLPAESATAALRFCSRHPGKIDLMLSDVVLPRTSGPEIARRAVELRPEMRVLFMSGFTDATLTRHGLEPGTHPLLEKPFSPAAVLSKVRSSLDGDIGPTP